MESARDKLRESCIYLGFSMCYNSKILRQEWHLLVSPTRKITIITTPLGALGEALQSNKKNHSINRPTQMPRAICFV
jgi:hypothetical protein